MTTVPANVQFNKQKSKWTIGQIILVAVIFVFVLTCVLPFVIPDAIKLFLADLVAKRLERIIEIKQ